MQCIDWCFAVKEYKEIGINSVDVFWFAWPWLCFGGAVVFFVVLFATNTCRSNEGPRWKDPYWLAWLLPPVLMLHQFEEYACHITNGQYDMIAMMTVMFSNHPLLMNASVPMAHFPVMNLVFSWIALPVAAVLSKRNPVIGLSAYGFILVNGITHGVSTVGLGAGLLQSPGFFTGFIGFILLVVLVIAVTRSGEFMNGKALAIALISGALGHVLLGGVYVLSVIGGAPAVLIGDVIVSFSPMLIAMALSGGLVMKDSLKKA